jgi:hypothetical protein
MNENILKEFYIGRTVFLEPDIFTKEHVENPLKTLTFLETKFEITRLQLHNFGTLLIKLNNDDEFEFIIEHTDTIDLITCRHYDNYKKEEYKLFLDKNDNLKIYQTLHYPNLISQKEKELENLKTKLSTINNF